LPRWPSGVFGREQVSRRRSADRDRREGDDGGIRRRDGQIDRQVEIKSKANGIIERLHVDVDQVVQPGQILAELDRENLMAWLREARANLQAAEASEDASVAQVKKNEIEAESPDVDLARRNHVRAQQLFTQKLIPQSALDEAKSALDQAENRRRAAGGQLVIVKRVPSRRANVAQARAAVERAEEELASATIVRRPRTVLTRDVGGQPGVVDSQPARMPHW
jgi:HlyD family secretion protein